VEKSEAAAVEMGLKNDYIYLNYAGPGQLPFASYGAANVQRLKEISNKYDPAQVFEVLQPGGFKLNM
jgi:hypothetical protein